jgi:hypothetical protein
VISLFNGLKNFDTSDRDDVRCAVCCDCLLLLLPLFCVAALPAFCAYSETALPAVAGRAELVNAEGRRFVVGTGGEADRQGLRL